MYKRQYDIRGKADRDLTDEIIVFIGKAFGTTVLQKGLQKVLIGMDNRQSSPRINKALTEGLLSTGCQVIDLGIVATPIFYYARVKSDTEAGVMITGSHNPAEDNGLKLALGAATIYGEEIQDLRRLIEKNVFTKGQGTRSTWDPIPAYKEMLKEKINLHNKTPKVVVDCGNGTASYFAVDILTAWGCQVVPLYCEPAVSYTHLDVYKRQR